MRVGLQLLGGMLAFFVVEKLARLRHGSAAAHNHGHSHGGDTTDDHQHSDTEPAKASNLAGLLNLIGDVTHNATDGMAIAASFLASPALGVTTAIAVLIHEVPHEVGDLAILLQSGWSVAAAVWVQLLTASGAVAGAMFVHWAATAAAVKSYTHTDISALLLPFTAGGFIYVAMVDVLPTLLEGKQSVRQSLKELVAMCSGVGLMYVIGIYE